MELSENLASVRRRVEAAAERGGRDPASVELMAVTKGHPPRVVEDAAALGLRLFGENKVQEAKAKIGQCPSGLRWHMIGRLQTNKCRDAVQRFEMIQSVDRMDLAVEIDKIAGKSAKSMPVLIEVNIAGEASKFGYRPEALLAELDSLNAFPHMEIHGLMTLAPWTRDPEKTRPVFRGLRELKKRCEDRLGAPLPHLSMGMSGDFEIAIEEGATIVRLGTILFGERGKRA